MINSFSMAEGYRGSKEKGEPRGDEDTDVKGLILE